MLNNEEETASARSRKLDIISESIKEAVKILGLETTKVVFNEADDHEYVERDFYKYIRKQRSISIFVRDGDSFYREGISVLKTHGIEERIIINQIGQTISIRICAELNEILYGNISVPSNSLIQQSQIIRKLVNIIDISALYVAETSYDLTSKVYGRIYFNANDKEIISIEELLPTTISRNSSSKHEKIDLRSEKIPDRLANILKEKYHRVLYFKKSSYNFLFAVSLYRCEDELTRLMPFLHSILTNYIRLLNLIFRRESRIRSYINHRFRNTIEKINSRMLKIKLPSGERGNWKGIKSGIAFLNAEIMSLERSAYTPDGHLRYDDLVAKAVAVDDEPKKRVHEKGYLLGQLTKRLINFVNASDDNNGRYASIRFINNPTDVLSHAPEHVVSSVIIEILTNAVKHSLDGYVEVTGNPRTGGGFSLKFANLGYILTRTEKIEIPSLGVRSKRAIAHNVPGSGRGLYEAKELADQADLFVSFEPNLPLTGRWSKRSDRFQQRGSVARFVVTLDFPRDLIEPLTPA